MSATVAVVVRTRNRPAMSPCPRIDRFAELDDYEVVIVNDAGDEAVRSARS